MLNLTPARQNFDASVKRICLCKTPCCDFASSTTLSSLDVLARETDHHAVRLGVEADNPIAFTVAGGPAAARRFRPALRPCSQRARHSVHGRSAGQMRRHVMTQGRSDATWDASCLNSGLGPAPPPTLPASHPHAHLSLVPYRQPFTASPPPPC